MLLCSLFVIGGDNVTLLLHDNVPNLGLLHTDVVLTSAIYPRNYQTWHTWEGVRYYLQSYDMVPTSRSGGPGPERFHAWVCRECLHYLKGNAVPAASLVRIDTDLIR